MDTPTPQPVHLDVNIRGVVIPTWVAVFFAISTVAAAAVVLLSVLVFKSAIDPIVQSQRDQTKEIRILDVHIQDIENILIRNRMAVREDFAPHSSNPPSGGK